MKWLAWDRVTSLIDSATSILNWIALVIILTSMILLVTVDVLLRYVFNSPLTWGTEVNGWMLMAVVFMSIGYCWVQGGHIRMDLIYAHANSRGKAIMDILAAGVGLFLWGILLYQTCLDISSSIKLDEIGSESGIPLFPLRLLMALGLIAFCLQLAVSILRGFVGATRPGEKA